jgi:hypothetical protein
MRHWAIGAALLAGGCGQGIGSSEHTSQDAEDLRNQATPYTFAIELPSGSALAQTAIGANGSIVLERGAKVLGSSGGYSSITNAGRDRTVVAEDVAIGGVASRGDIELLPHSVVHGSALSGGAIRSFRASVLGSATQHDTALSPPLQLTWTAPTAGASAGSVRVDHHATRDLVPGTYSRLDVEPGSTLTLHPGVYFFQSIDVERDATVEFSGPSVIYASSYVKVDGVFKDDLGQASLLLAYSGDSSVEVDGAFAGTIVSPKASLRLRGRRQVGSFFAKDIEVEENVQVVHVAAVAPPSPCVGTSDGTACTGAGSAQSVCEAGACVALTCNRTTTSSSDGQSTTVTEDFGSGPLTLTRNVLVPSTGENTTTIDISKGGVAVLHEVFTGIDANGAETTEVDLGDGFHGASTLTLASSGGLVSGTIDGKAIRPFNPSTATASSVVLADGSPFPSLTADDGVIEQIRALMKADGASAAQCGVPLVALNVAPPPPPDPPSPPVEEGHPGETQFLKSCTDCRDTCNNSFEVCDGTATAGCIGIGALFEDTVLGFIVGAGCSVVIDYACGKTQESCLASCNDPGHDCCPQACGKNGCCAATGVEFCLDPKQALCCDAEYSPCPGPQPSCFDPTQAFCLPSGRSCQNGIGTCGTGEDAFCCDGMCVDGKCTLGPKFALTVGITQSSLGDLSFCLSGTGFTPLGPVTVEIGTIPGNDMTGPRPGFEFTTAQADGNGSFSAVVHQSVFLLACQMPINPGLVTLTGNDVTSGNHTVTAFPGGYYCNNVESAAEFGGGCDQ